MSQTSTTIETNQASWYKHWFDSSFYRQLYANRNDTEARSFVQELVNDLDPAPGATALDLGCAHGRHSICLANLGLTVTGIDLAASAIAIARKLDHPHLSFHRQDMREPFGTRCFDYVFSFFTSFGYFDEEEDNHRVAANISRSLKKGGHLILDYLNVTPAEKKTIAKEEKEIDGIIYRIDRWSDARHFFKEITILVEDQPPVRYREQVAKLSLDYFHALFAQHGLTIEKVYGNYQLDEYEEERSARLIMKAVNNLAIC